MFSFYFLNSHEKTLVLTSRIGHLEVSDNVTQVQKVSFELFQNKWSILKEIKLFFQPIFISCGRGVNLHMKNP